VLELPTLPGGSGLPPPALVAAPPRSPEHGPPVTWTTVRDVLARTTTCQVDHGSTSEIEGGSVSEHYTGDVCVHTTTFAQEARATAEFAVSWEQAKVRTRAELWLRAGRSSYDVVLTVTAEENGTLFAERRWERRIARDLA
jgi:uncharacterized protein